MNHWQTTPLSILTSGPVVPVMVIEQLEQAVPLAQALLVGGVKILEITLRTEVAVGAIARIAAQLPEAIVGAGTVTNPEQLAAVTAAGAHFAISPGLTPELLVAANAGPIPLIPGISTVSEMMVGMAHGLQQFKFFPAEAAGGIKMLKAISGPFPYITFCPTGGIAADNYREYLALPNVACVGGSWLVPKDAVANGDWQRITELAAQTSGA